jgi:hypothetical protein
MKILWNCKNMSDLCFYHLDWYKPKKFKTLEDKIKLIADSVGKAAFREKKKMIVVEWVASNMPNDYRHRKGHKVYSLGSAGSGIIKNHWKTRKCKSEIDDHLVAVAVAVPRRNGALVSIRLVLAEPKDGRLFDLPLAKAYEFLESFNRKKTEKSRAALIESSMAGIFKEASEEANLMDVSGNTPDSVKEKRKLIRKARDAIRLEQRREWLIKPLDIRERLAIKLLKGMGHKAADCIEAALCNYDSDHPFPAYIFGTIKDIARRSETFGFLSYRRASGWNYVLGSTGRWITLTKVDATDPSVQGDPVKIVYRPHWDYESPECDPELLIEADVNEWKREDLYGRILMHAALGKRVLCKRTEFVVRTAGSFVLIDNGLGRKRIEAVIFSNGFHVRINASSDHGAMLRAVSKDGVDRAFDEIINALSGHLRMAVSANKPVKKRRMVLE